MHHYSIATIRAGMMPGAPADVSPSDGRITSTALRDFMTQLQSAMPAVKFLYKTSRAVFVYVDSCDYALGYIAYTDSGSGTKYAVFSRSIENKKYSTGRDQHNMLESTNIKVALRNAKTHLRPYSVADMAFVGWDHGARPKFQKALEPQVSRSIYIVNAEVSAQSSLLRELGNLVDMGHTFLDPAYGESVREWLAIHRQREATAKSRREIVFVRVTEDWRGQVLQLQPLGEVEGEYMVGAKFDPALTVVTPAAEADALIVGRVSVLSMTPVGTCVLGVGVRTGERSFYVEV